VEEGGCVRCAIKASKWSKDLLFSVPPKAQKEVLVPVLDLAEPEKAQKAPPVCLACRKAKQYPEPCWNVCKRKSSYVSRLPFIGFAVEMNERKMLLSFFTISRRGTKRAPHNIRGTNIQSNNLRGALSRDSFTKCTTSHATRTAYGQQHTNDALQERAYTERTTQTIGQFPTPTRRVLSDREPYATGVSPLSIPTRLSHHATILPE
jgi:hypothetical protein